MTILPVEAESATPPCPHFGPCGGCQLQHLAYPAQLALKADRLNALLASADLALPELQLHPSPPLGYRNRIRLTLAEAGGQLRAGYLDAAAAFLPISECPIAAPILWRTAEAFLSQINLTAALWLRNPQGALDQLELFTAADESSLQLMLYLRTAAKTLPAKLSAAFAALCETLRAAVPELSGAGLAILPLASSQRSRRTEAARTAASWGAPGLIYSIPGDTQAGSVILSEAKNPRISPLPLAVPQQTTGNQQPATYWVPRGAFFQTNRFLLPELLTLATNRRTGHLAFDLYAGVGLFSRALAGSFAQVVAVEIAEPAASALAATKLPNLRAVKSTTLDFLRTAVLDRDRPDLILLDPPRAGAGAEICALLGRMAAPMVVYVSCSPETLLADLAILAASGYRIAELHLLDLFPQTNHIETVAVLAR